MGADCGNYKLLLYAGMPTTRESSYGNEDVIESYIPSVLKYKMEIVKADCLLAAGFLLGICQPRFLYAQGRERGG